MAVNKAALKSPNGLLKIVALVLTIVVLILARTGFNSLTGEILYAHIDHRWLTIVTTGAYVIILSTIILTYILGDAIPIKTELIFIFVGAVLFLAVGGLTIDQYQNHAKGSTKDTALATGSLAIINGIVMVVDAALIGKAMKGK